MKTCILTLCVCLTAFGAVCLHTETPEPQVAHMVYFELKDDTPEARNKLVDACNKLLSKHEGTIYYSAGVLAHDLNREVNVRNFSVGLHLVFKNKAAHDRYQAHERHLQFIDQNKAGWKSVRVFDAYVSTESRAANR